MAIVISKNSALNDDLWKPVGQVLNAVMLDTDAEKSKYDELVGKIAVEKKSKKYAEKQSGLTALSTFSITNEGDVAPMDDFQEATPKLIVHNTFKKEVAMTKEMLDDGDIDGMKTMAAQMVKAYKRTRLDFLTQFITSQAATFSYGGKTGLDSSTGDGEAIFSQNHKSVKGDVGVQSNVFTNALDVNTLIRLANIMRNYKNESGVVTGFTANKIIIPGNCWQMEETIRRIIDSDKLIATDYNDVNTQKGKWELVVDPLWQVAAGKNPYILMSDECKNETNGIVFYDRVALDVKNDVDIHTRDLIYNGYARMGVGVNNWRCILAGGMDNGTTLS